MIDTAISAPGEICFSIASTAPVARTAICRPMRMARERGANKPPASACADRVISLARS